MDWSSLYRAPHKSIWKGRSDGPGAERYHEIVELKDLRKGIPSVKNPATFGLIGFVSELGIERNKGRLGAKQGPEALRRSLATMPAPDPAKFTLYDLGDIVCGKDLEHAQASLGIIVAMLLAQGVRPVVIGGGHEVAWGNYQGVATFNPSLHVPIVNFDAHYDLRPLEDNLGTSGTSFTQIYLSTQERKLLFDYTVIGLQPQSNTRALHSFAKDLNVTTITAEQVASDPSILQGFQKGNTPIYLSMCLDVFGAPFAPGVSAPQPLGIMPSSILTLFRRLAPFALSFDIAELSPPHDIENRTSNLAATFVSLYLNSTLLSI